MVALLLLQGLNSQMWLKTSILGNADLYITSIIIRNLLDRTLVGMLNYEESKNVLIVVYTNLPWKTPKIDM